MITGKVSGGPQVLATISEFARVLPARIVRVINEFAIDVTANAKRLVPVKTGKLSRSIHYEITQTSEGASGIVGTDVEYAGVVEQGFQGKQSVREFMRLQKMAWGRSIMPRMVSVRAHDREVNRAAKPYLVPALMDTRPTLRERLMAEVKSAPGVKQ